MWKHAGKSSIGSAHLAGNLKCQDYWDSKIHHNNSSRLLMAISDGAGFASAADIGAQLAVEECIGQMQMFDGQVAKIGANEVEAWLSAVQLALRNKAIECSLPESDFSCTLLAATIENGTGHFWQIGDGGWVVNCEAIIEAATWPYSGEFINETAFVTSEKAKNIWTQAYYENLTHVIGFTDGIEHLILDFPNRQAHVPLVSKLFQFSDTAKPDVARLEKAISDLLESSLVLDRTDDDKTMVFAYRCDSTENDDR